MAAASSWTLSLRCAVVLLGMCSLGVQSADPPGISANGVFILGRWKVMKCYTATASSGITLKWTRNGSDLQSLTTDASTSSAKILALNITVQASDHEQAYVCSAISSSSTESVTWIVYVYNGPNTPYYSGPASVLGDTTRTWFCIVEGASFVAPTVKWKFANNNTAISDSRYNHTETLYDDTTTSLEAYNVTSKLTLPITIGAPNFTLRCDAVQSNSDLKSSKDFHVHVMFAPEVSVSTNQITATAEATVTLPCTVSASPAVSSVTWYHNGVKVSRDNDRISGSSSSTPSMTIDPVKKADAGNYICGAINSVAATNSTVVVLVVRYGPSISYGAAADTGVSGVRGSDLVVACFIDAVPAYTNVYWYRVNTGDKTLINSTASPTKYAGGTATTTPNITIKGLADSDAGLYKCEATNDVGSSSDEGNVEVAVHFAPGSVTVTDHNTSGYDVGDTITLTCSATSRPSAEYRWYGGSAFDVLLGSGSTLSYRNATPEMAGDYRCMASNDVGSANKTVTVVVYYKPRAGSNSNVTAAIGDTVTLTCNVKAHPAATSYIWKRGVVTVGSASTSNTLSVTVENNDDFGRYDCKATNTKGTSDAIPIHLLEGDGGTTGQSTEDTGLSVATLILIIIICLIILVVIILVIIYCCSSGKCRCMKKDNDVAPSVVPLTAAPPVVPIADKPPATIAASTPNGHLVSSSPSPRSTANGVKSVRLDMDEDKTAPPASLHIGTSSLGHGLSICVPGDSAPRPYHLPPLGQNGEPEETKSARDDKPKKRKRRRRHNETKDAAAWPQNDIEV